MHLCSHAWPPGLHGRPQQPSMYMMAYLGACMHLTHGQTVYSPIASAGIMAAHISSSYSSMHSQLESGPCHCLTSLYQQVIWHTSQYLCDMITWPCGPTCMTPQGCILTSTIGLVSDVLPWGVMHVGPQGQVIMSHRYWDVCQMTCWYNEVRQWQGPDSNWECMWVSMSC